MDKALYIRFILVAVLVGFLSACTKIDPVGPVSRTTDTENVRRSAEERGYFNDGDVIVLNRATATDSPVVVVILPDGFTREELTPDSPFLQRARVACDALFEIQPMKGLKDYVEVDVKFHASAERGLTLAGKTVNTFFGTSRGDDGPSDYRCDRELVHHSLAGIPGANGNKIALLLVNEEGEGATTYPVFVDNGSSNTVCIVPAFCRDEEKFRCSVWHECIGHAIGCLEDEYVNNEGTVSEEKASQLKKLQDLGFCLNVSLSKENTPWDKYIGLKGYEDVSCYEGAALWSKGVYRSEENSIMRNRTLRFNAVSRECIYKRVMTLAGKTCSWEKFLEFDNNKR